jgi:5-methylcytosine-specific restriction protein B
MLVGRFIERGGKVYELIERWRDECLIGDASLLFDDESVWTQGNLDRLYARYNDNPLEGDNSFEDKLAEQLGGDQALTRLTAECLVVYFAFAVGAVGGARKRELITTVLSWADDELDGTSDVAKAMDGGIGNPGQGFNNFRWAHLAYIVSVVRDFKRLEPGARRHTLSDPWQFRDWLVSVDEDLQRMMRHILLHLLFPDHFERIASTSHKRLIASTFSDLVPDLDDDDNNVDRQLFDIRARIAELLGKPPTTVDFYTPPVREAWYSPADDGGALTHLGALEYKKQVVLYGPPGTGKTYEAKELAEQLLHHQALLRWGPAAYFENRPAVESAVSHQIRRLQLHQGWSYEQFIGGLKLTELGTAMEDGYLLKLIDEISRSQAEEASLPRLPWVLVLDEINRTDLSRLLGEAFSAIDDRDSPIDLPGFAENGSRRSLTVPGDLHIIGTLNLIDQSVEQLDFALRRRFLWLHSGFQTDDMRTIIEVKWEALDVARRHPFGRLEADIDVLIERAQALNDEISRSQLLGEQYQIGHTYFFDIVAFISRWPRVAAKGNRPSRYLWSKAGRPQPPIGSFWTYALRPLLEEYLAGIEPDARRSELDRLNKVFITV